jgi:hypothetical protein
MEPVPSTRRTRQRWDGDIDGHTHRVDVAGSVRRCIVWRADGRTIAARRAWLPRVHLHHDLATVVVRAHRVTVHPPGSRLMAASGIGGGDLAPEPGSLAARREQEIADHPVRFAIRQIVGALATVLVPLALVALLAKAPQLLQHFGVPLPSLPSLPIPQFDLTDIGAPAWIQRLLDSSDYVTPIAIAIAVVWFELRRRRHQRRRQRREP